MLQISTSASCNRCGHYVDYYRGHLLCPKCRNLMRISPEDIKNNLSDFYELYIPYTLKKYNNRFEKFHKLAEKYEIDFIGFDPFYKLYSTNYTGMLNIGWENGFPENLSVIIKELKSILR